MRYCFGKRTLSCFVAMPWIVLTAGSTQGANIFQMSGSPNTLEPVTLRMYQSRNPIVTLDPTRFAEGFLRSTVYEGIGLTTDDWDDKKTPLATQLARHIRIAGGIVTGGWVQWATPGRYGSSGPLSATLTGRPWNARLPFFYTTASPVAILNAGVTSLLSLATDNSDSQVHLFPKTFTSIYDSHWQKREKAGYDIDHWQYSTEQPLSYSAGFGGSAMSHLNDRQFLGNTTATSTPTNAPPSTLGTGSILIGALGMGFVILLIRQ